MKHELFKMILDYPYEKFQTKESFYKPVKLGRGEKLSTSKKLLYPSVERNIGTQSIVEKK